MRELFLELRPQVVFHAAALQARAADGGEPGRGRPTNAVARASSFGCAGESGARRFVLISTDKAVTPAT